MELAHIYRTDEHYPEGLRFALGKDAPAKLTALGNKSLLAFRTLALFCSAKCPGNLILKTYDLARQLREGGVPVISGFHSPMEQECLRILLRGSQPVIICPARSLEQMRIPKDWCAPLNEGRLLLLSPFTPSNIRSTATLVKRRNLFVAALAEKVLAAHAAPSSKIESLCREIIGKRPLLTLDSDSNDNLLRLGAAPIKISDVQQLLKLSRPAVGQS